MSKIMKTLVIFFLINLINITIGDQSDTATTQQVDFIELAAKHGYPAERHNLTTDDGYNLVIFRIPSSNISSPAEGKPAVLLEHGLGISSDCWAIYDRSLAYLLADSGYDVWLGNHRGNRYSYSHLTLSRDNPLFWNYSMQEIGSKDFASTTDYILNVTNMPNLTLIGHSLGAVSTLVFLSERPEYNNKINGAIVMSPPVFRYMHPFIRMYMEKLYELKDRIDPNGMASILSGEKNSVDLGKACVKYNIKDLCDKADYINNNNGSEQSSMADVVPFMTQALAGSSTKCVWHVCQGALNGRLQKYDYEKLNLDYYGQSQPPQYKLKNIATNMLVVYSLNDPNFTLKDAEFLSESMTSANVTAYQIKYEKFSHFDFMAAKDLKTLLHDKVLAFLCQVNNK